MATIVTRHLFTATLEVGAPQPLGPAAAGERRVVPVTGGRFEGERMRGEVMPGGSDWLVARADGATALDVRLVLRMADGGLVGMTYRGVRHGPADVMARLAAGEEVDPSDYYFRIAPMFETGAPAWDWLNRIVAVGTGRRPPSGPVYDVFEVL